MGASCDWDYLTFTLDPIPNKAVKKFFCDMYNQKMIYQSDYIVNWDPMLQSAVSDAEVEHKDARQVVAEDIKRHLSHQHLSRAY